MASIPFAADQSVVTAATETTPADFAYTSLMIDTTRESTASGVKSVINVIRLASVNEV